MIAFIWEMPVIISALALPPIELFVGMPVIILAIALFPVLGQFKSEINNWAFKQIKIKHFAFLFRAPGGLSVSKEGIALPIFISQLVGYAFALVLAVLNVVFFFVSKAAFLRMALITLFVLAVEAITLIIFEIMLTRLSHSKQYFKRDKRK